ncbi:MAG TPA: hypothetical protein VFE55_02405 [Acidimicrobiia bacterium]|nr:hypothetical protein [Acidimicrobiia bacterium]
MWVEGGDIQDELLDQLGGVLAPPADLPLAPSVAELEALAAAVSARWPGAAADDRPAPGTAPVVPLRPAAGRRPLRRLGSSAWRAGSVAAAMVVLSASAAAAAGGVPLPRPVRAVAYTVGLPVDSPALDDTNHHIDELKAAVKANDRPKAVATARRLSTDLRKVPSDEKKQAEKSLAEVLPQAEPLIQNAVPPVQLPPLPPSPTTTATSPAASTTDTTAAKPKENEKAPAADTTTTERPTTTTTTAPEPTTTTTAPATPSDGGTPSGGTGSGSGSTSPTTGGATTGTGPGTGTGGGDQGSTTATTAPPTTTTTTAPAGGDPAGGDPASTTTTTTSSTTTTTTTMPPSDQGTPPQP